MIVGGAQHRGAAECVAAVEKGIVLTESLHEHRHLKPGDEVVWTIQRGRRAAERDSSILHPRNAGAEDARGLHIGESGARRCYARRRQRARECSSYQGPWHRVHESASREDAAGRAARADDVAGARVGGQDVLPDHLLEPLLASGASAGAVQQ